MASLRDRLRRQLGEPDTLRAETEVDPEEPEPTRGGVLEKLRRLQLSSRGSPTDGSRRGDIRRSRPSPSPAEGPVDPSRSLVQPPRIDHVEVQRVGSAALHGVVQFPPDHQHGRLPLADVQRLDGRAAVLLTGDADLAGFDVTQALFFDLETTGLIGGAGNLAFLTGALRVRSDGSAELHQLLLRDPSEEAAALAVFDELLADVDFLVSFNGKSFDRNVLADRLTMHRMPPGRVLSMPHLDLLHPARRLFRAAHGGSSLSLLEERELGVFRSADEVRGADVPGLWFDYLRSGQRSLLQPVIDHNAVDLLSLLTLGAHLVRCLEAPGVALPEPRALVAAARLLIERGEPERGEEVLRRLVEGTDDDPVFYGAATVYAEHLRRSGRHVEALPLWRRMIRVAGCADLEPWLRAAIALEWQLGRPGEALELVDDLLERLGAGGQLASQQPEIEALQRRRARLTARAAARPRGGPAAPRRRGRAGCDARAHTDGSGG